MKLAKEQGKSLLKLSRDSISSFLLKRDIEMPNNFDEKRGVFVTLHAFPDYKLRGCIGFVEDIFSIKEGVVRASRAAAFSDPRFNALSIDELKRIVISVSLLTKPELLKKEEVRNIKIGKDGLIVENGYKNGLLLPIVAVEQNWNYEEFLEGCCLKAGLNKDAWKEECKLFKFNTQVFSESKPGEYG